MCTRFLVLALAVLDIGSSFGFEPVQSIRSINIGASIAVSANDDSGFTDSASQGDGRTMAGYELVDEAVGLSQFGLSSPYGGGSGSGRASQISEMTSERVYFNGFADVYVSGSAGIDGTASGSGGATSMLTFTFRVSDPTAVRLDMSSSVLTEAFSEFTFSLWGKNSGLIWDQVGVERDFNFLKTFSVDLPLAPDEYQLSAYVSASSSFDGDVGYAGQSRAEVTLTVIPEPEESALLFCAGLLAFALGRRFLVFQG